MSKDLFVSPSSNLTTGTVDVSNRYKVIITVALIFIGLVFGVLYSSNILGDEYGRYIEVYLSIFTSIVAIYWMVIDSKNRGSLVSNGWIISCAIFTTLSMLIYAFNTRGFIGGIILIIKYLAYYSLCLMSLGFSMYLTSIY